MWDQRIIRVLVTKEAIKPKHVSMGRDDLGHLVMKETPNKNETVYVAIALEHYVVSQGPDLDDLREEMEQLLVVQEHLDANPIDVNHKPSGPAPEDYQRMRNFGDKIIHADKFWREKIGSPPIVARWDIDISKSDWKVVNEEEDDDDCES